MTLKQTADALQKLFNDENRCVEGNWVVPEKKAIIAILQRCNYEKRSRSTARKTLSSRGDTALRQAKNNLERLSYGG